MYNPSRGKSPRHLSWRQTVASAAVFIAAAAAPASAQFVIVPTFDSSVTSDPNAATIEATINATISVYENTLANKMSVPITYYETTSGLSSNAVNSPEVTYQQFRAGLAAQPASLVRTTALANLPNTTNNPVNSNAGMFITTANADVLGLPDGGSIFNQLFLNTSVMNLSRGSDNPAKYDMMGLIEHETDEVLGIGGQGSSLNQVANGNQALTDPIGSMDLYRYSASGVRSYTTSGAATSYFSVNGGATNLTAFNQNDNDDYADWVEHSPEQVQDAVYAPGTTANLGVNELTALQAVGYTLKATVPAPDSLSVIMACLAVAGTPNWLRRAKLRSLRR